MVYTYDLVISEKSLETCINKVKAVLSERNCDGEGIKRAIQNAISIYNNDESFRRSYNKNFLLMCIYLYEVVRIMYMDEAFEQRKALANILCESGVNTFWHETIFYIIEHAVAGEKVYNAPFDDLCYAVRDSYKLDKFE